MSPPTHNTMSSYTSSPRANVEDDPYEIESSDPDDERDEGSDEDTEDASETEEKQIPTPNHKENERMEMKEQMYQTKLAHLKHQLQMLQDGTLPEFVKRNRKLVAQYQERLRVNEIWKQIEFELTDREYKKEKEESCRELEEKKAELMANLIFELEDKKRAIDTERTTTDLNAGRVNGIMYPAILHNGNNFMEVKPTVTRKLRRRPNDPTPVPEKRRKPSPAQLNYMLDEDEVSEDFRIINKISGKPVQKKIMPPPLSIDTGIIDCRIEDGRLHYDKKWFCKGSSVFVDCKDSLGSRIAGSITNVGTQEIWVKKNSDHSKIRIYVSQLQRGKYVLKRRATS